MDNDPGTAWYNAYEVYVRFLLLIVVLVCIAAPAGHALEIRKLTLQECISIALKNQPSIRSSEQGVTIGEGRETQVRSALFPQITASTGYAQNRAKGGAFGESITKSYTSTLSMNFTLYDFGRTGNAIDAARWNTRAAERELERTVQTVVLNVKQAFYALLAANNVVDVAVKRVEQTESRLRQAQAFFQAGSKPRFEVTRAEVDLNSAKLSLINAQNTVRLQRIILNNAMGVDPGQPTEIESQFPPVENAVTLEQAQQASLVQRPEMLKADADIEAAKARLHAEEANYLPMLSANGAYNWASGTSEMGEFNGTPLRGDIGNSWNAGVMLSLPLFQGGVTRGRVSEARANFVVLQQQREAVRQSVLLEVNQSYADLESAKVRIDVMDSSLQKARESLDLAQGRYEAGIGPHIEVTDAQLAAVQAEIDRIQAHYDYELSFARLLKAMGKTE